MTRLFRPRLRSASWPLSAITLAALWLAGGPLPASPRTDPFLLLSAEPIILPKSGPILAQNPSPNPEPILLPDPPPSPAPILAPSPDPGPAPAPSPSPEPGPSPSPAPGDAAAAAPGPTPGRKAGKGKRPGNPAQSASAAKSVPGGPAGGVPVYTETSCVALALRQNPDVLAAAKRIEASAATVTTAKGATLPSLTTSGFYQRLDQSIANGGQLTTTVNSQGQTVVTQSDFNRPNDYYADVRITQNLYSGQAVRNRIAAAKLQTEAAKFDYQAQLDVTTLAVRAAFYNTLYAEANIGVRQQAVDLLSAQVKDQQDKLAAGTVGQLNVNRAQVQLANERPALLDAQAALSTAYAALAQELGVSYGTGGSLRPPFRVSGALEFRPMPMTLAECLQRALAARPEVQSRLLAIDALKHLVIVEKSTTRPQISAFAAYDLYSEPDLRTVDSYYSGYTLGVNASWTLFDGFATRGRVRGVQAQIGEAEALLASTRKQVENDVYTAYSDLRSAESSLQPLSNNIRLASETLDLTTRNFDAGIITSQLDVLQARVDLTRSRAGEVAGRLAYDTALARLERAMALGRPALGSATSKK